MRFLRFRRAIFVFLLTIIALLLLVSLRSAAANHNHLTSTMLLSPTPVHDDLPFTQADLVRFEGRVARPNGMIWHKDKIYIICAGDQTIYQLYGTTGVTETYIHGITDAHTLYAEEDDGEFILWVPDYERGTLLRITATDIETMATDLVGPWSILYLNPTTFLISNRLSGTIEAVNRAGKRTEILTGLSLPTGIVRDGRYLYVANSGDPARAIEWYDLFADNNGEVADHLLIPGLVYVMGMQLGSDGKLYFAYSQNGLGAVGRIDPVECRLKGGCTADEIERVLVSDMNAPLAGLTFSPDGRLFVHQRHGTGLYWMSLNVPPAE